VSAVPFDLHQDPSNGERLHKRPAWWLLLFDLERKRSGRRAGETAPRRSLKVPE
jgi:hypothetical protein